MTTAFARRRAIRRRNQLHIVLNLFGLGCLAGLVIVLGLRL